MDELKKVKMIKRLITLMFIMFSVIAIGTFINLYLVNGNDKDILFTYKWGLCFASSILAINSYIVMKLSRKAEARLLQNDEK